MYNTSVPLPLRKGVSVFFMFFDVHAKLTIIEDILFLRINPGASKSRPRALGEGIPLPKALVDKSCDFFPKAVPC